MSFSLTIPIYRELFLVLYFLSLQSISFSANQAPTIINRNTVNNFNSPKLTKQG